MSAPFDSLLKDLGQRLGTPLKSDPHQSCRIDFGQGVEVQLELSHNADKLLIGTTLGEVPKGPLYNKILKEALRFNGVARIPRGILALNPKNNTLILFQFHIISLLNGEKLFSLLLPFIDHTRSWIQALSVAQTPSIEEVVNKL